MQKSNRAFTKSNTDLFHGNLFLGSLLVSFSSLLGCDGSDRIPLTTDSNDSNTEETVETAPLNAEGQWAQNYLEEMTAVVAGAEEFATLNQLEAFVKQTERDVIQPWVQSWKSSDLNDYSALFSNSDNLVDWNGGQVQDRRIFGGIKESYWTLEHGNDSAAAYLEGFGQIEDFDLKVVHIAEEGELITATLEYDLRGIRKADQLRQQDRGHITIVCQKGDVLKVQSISTSTMERNTAQRAPAYIDATSEWNLVDTVPMEDRKEAIRRGGYALVVSDYDQDGRNDMLVGNYGPIKLLRNTETGFVDVTSESGLDPEEVIKGAGFVDMDNDGDRDIAMLRFAEANDPRGDFVIYENNGDGSFTKHSNVLPRRRSYDTPMPLSMGDYNNDGFVDIYIGFPGMRDFTSGISTSERPEWLASQGIWFNQGDWTFVEADDDNAVVADNDTYSHAAASTDLDGDGWMDLLVVDDSGRMNPVFKNSGTGNFELLAPESGLTHAGLSMGVSTGDFNNDGHLDIMSSHVAMNAGRRMGDSMEGLVADESNVGQLMNQIRNSYADVQLFINNGDGTFTDHTANAGLNWAGEAAGAGEWLDYNHDGLLDYYLPNGLWSNGDETLDSVFFRAELLLYGMSILGGDESPVAFDLTNDVHGGAIFSKSEQGGNNPVLTLLRNHREHGDAPLTYSFAGYQRNALYRNNGDGTFTEVAFLEGVDRIEDGYIVAPVDVDGDGLQDMVLRNTDPALEHAFQPVIALKNQLSANTLTVALHNPNGNTDGLGARVTVHIGDQIMSREIRSVSGAVQGEPVAYFGLGSQTQVDKVVVIWPGGDRQEVTDITLGRMLIEKE